MKMLFVFAKEKDARLLPDVFVRRLAELGEFEIVQNGASLTEEALLAKMRGVDVILGGWGSVRVPDAIGADPGRVRYLCSITGSVRYFASLMHIEAGLLVSNWGDAIAHSVAEGAVCLLLATLKDLHAQVVAVRAGGGALDSASSGGTLEGATVGVYGFGAIGRRFAEFLQPYRCELLCFDPFVEEYPAYVTPVATLRDLFIRCSIVAIHAGLNDETRGSVTKELLALLPRHGVVINTARGDVVDQEALFDELRSGRLRAGLDVLAGRDWLEPDDPMRQAQNLLWTCHKIGRGWPTDGEPPTRLLPMHEVCLDNLRRFRDGLPLRFLMDRRRYLLST